jgi:hypothetical protein
MTTLRTERLANGIELTFVDCSNRYFGDYHRVCVAVRVSVPPPAGPLQLARHLERMAVPGAELAAVRDRLIADFLRHAGAYLARPETPARLAAAEAAGRGRPRR